MKFAYARTGGPLLNWSGPTPPSPSRAGETRSLGGLPIPLPGAPEIIGGYEEPQPGAATIHLGGFIPEGSIRNYGTTVLGADEPKFDVTGLVRKAGIIASAYHGVKRNNGSIMSGLLWALAAWVVFPMHGTIVPAVAIAQGFAQPKLRNNPAFTVRIRKADGSWKILRKKKRRKQRSASKRKTAKRRVQARTQRYDTRRGY